VSPRVVFVLLAGAVLALSSCVGMNDTPRRLETGEAIPLNQVPAQAKDTIQRETAGAKLEGINVLKEGDQTFYVVEAATGGKTLWLKVSADGRVKAKALHEDLKIDQLPPEVRAAVERELQDGKIQGLRHSTQGSRSYYEAELQVGGKEIDLTIGASGRDFEKHVVEPK
jgi:hypothetical protein